MKTLAHRNIPITIIGGGIHGCSIALRLLRDKPSASKHIAIVDRHPKPLLEWRNKTERQGMTFLRSPAVHHISPDPLGIVDFAKKHNRTSELAPPYSQPSTELFWNYSNDVVTELVDHNIYYKFEVSKLVWNKGAGKYPFRLVSKDKIGFRSSSVVLAIGSDDCAYIPPEFIDWKRRYPEKIVHSSQFTVNNISCGEIGKRYVIVGGGLTGGTLAKNLSDRGHHVVLVARKQLKTKQFDFQPIWLGPKSLADFSRESDFQRRYQIIEENRGEGSITPEIMESLKNNPNVEIYPNAQIRNIDSEKDTNSGKDLQFSMSEDEIANVSQIILATGYRFNLSRYGFINKLIKNYSIPLICGFPKLDSELQFTPIENLFCTGTIAQLQIGPASSNIAGASLAYDRMRENLWKQLPQSVLQNK